METPIQPRMSQTVNVGRTERVFSLLTGLGLMSYLVLRRPRSSLPLGICAGYMTYRGATGRDFAYQAMGIARIQENGHDGIYVQHSITVNRPRDELYRIWRNFENLPRFMKHLASVDADEASDRKHSHWITKGPLGRQIEWDSEVTEDCENELLAWQSLPGSIVESRGRVEFMDAPGGRGTILHVDMQYLPLGGSVGAAFAKLFGDEPGQQVRDDLRAFKQIIETGEIATTRGQPSGRGGRAGRVPVKPKPGKDQVERASEDSFPASDPPGWISKEE